MLETINRLHDRVNEMVSKILLRAKLAELKETKQLNQRQYAIMTILLTQPEPLSVAQVKQQPWFIALYDKLSDKTKARDLAGLKALGMGLSSYHAHRLKRGVEYEK